MWIPLLLFLSPSEGFDLLYDFRLPECWEHSGYALKQWAKLALERVLLATEKTRLSQEASYCLASVFLA